MWWGACLSNGNRSLASSGWGGCDGMTTRLTTDQATRCSETEEFETKPDSSEVHNERKRGNGGKL